MLRPPHRKRWSDAAVIDRPSKTLYARVADPGRIVLGCHAFRIGLPTLRRAQRGHAMKRGLYLIQLPPPVHGVSVMNQCVVRDRMNRSPDAIEVLRLGYSTELSEINRATVSKFVRWVRLALALLMALLRRRPAFVYFTLVPTGAGFLRDLPFVVLVKTFRIPLILHLHGRGIAEQAANPRWRRLYRRGLRRCIVISASPAMQARELAPLDLAGCRLYVVPNTVERVDVPRYRPLHGASTQPRLLFLSNTFPPKGIFILLEALRRLVRRGIEFDAEIVGSSTPEFDDAIRAFIASEALGEQVHCRGALFDDDKCMALGRADIFVHPSLNDYFPLVILEAMQFGLAIVSTRVGAIPEMVVDGIHGTLVPAGDAEALTLAIENLLGAPDQVRRMGAASRCRYEQLYSPERFSAALQSVLHAEGLA